ncbi:MAG: FtsX-like permease family protein [Chloroflexia bacterium]
MSRFSWRDARRAHRRWMYAEGGTPAEQSAVVPLAQLQELTGNVGKIDSIVITHVGDAVAGGEHTDATVAALGSVLAGTGLEAAPVKRDALTRADQDGSQFANIFTLFGGFSIAAGVMLIFLIFIMLAAERKRELGIARGVGMQRRHVVRMFTFEGTVYSMLAAAVGSLLGVAVGWLMVRVITAAFGQFGDSEVVFAFQWRSLIIAYVLGMVLTLVVVLFSSWRASRLNVVRAIRDIPEPTVGRGSWKGLVGGLLLIVLGAASTFSGVSAGSIALFMLGTSLLVIGAALLARRSGVPDRLVFTTAGVALLVWWLLPNSVSDAVLPAVLDNTGGIEMFFLSGIMIVIAAVWTVVYNSDLLLAGIVAVLGRVRGLPPVLKTAVSYPMMNRFRTGMTLVMISLVMFTLVVMSFIIGSLGSIWDDPDRWSGGYDVRLCGLREPDQRPEGRTRRGRGADCIGGDGGRRHRGSPRPGESVGLERGVQYDEPAGRGPRLQHKQRLYLQGDGGGLRRRPSDLGRPAERAGHGGRVGADSAGALVVCAGTAAAAGPVRGVLPRRDGRPAEHVRPGTKPADRRRTPSPE